MTKNNVQTQPTNLPAKEQEEFERMMLEDAGKGTSQAAEDNLVPLIYVLDAKSPQVNRRDGNYIEGAEAGDIWLRHAPVPIIKGTEGFIFLPCFWFKDYVEWIPRDSGGGFAGRHKDLPAECKVEKDLRSGRVRNYMPNGNELVLTYNHAGFALIDKVPPMPYLIPMKSTGLAVSKLWMTMMNQKVSDDGKIYPSYSFRYRLTTKPRHNKEGDWFLFDITDDRMLRVDERELWIAGKKLRVALETGQRIAEAEVPAGGEQSNSETF